MKISRYIFTASLSAVFVALSFLSFVSLASAQEIEVDYGGGPLFSEADFLPGDAEVRTFTVENLSGSDKEVRLRTISESNSGLAEVLRIIIKETGGPEYFNDTLLELFIQDFVSLGNIASGETISFDVDATFLPDSDNNYQGGTAGFAVCVGFAGTNENCVTDTSTPGDNNDGGGGNNDDDLPEGRIAGESTSTSPVPTFLNGPSVTDFIDFIRGSVLGDMAEATSSTSTASFADEGIAETEENKALALADPFFANCTFIWLLFLVVISFLWSLFTDRPRKQSVAMVTFLIRNAVFSLLYVIALVVFNYFERLEEFWWIFAGAWAIATAFDYFSHKKLVELWSAKKRNLYYAVAGLIGALLGLFTPILCVWMPFAVIAVVSAVLHFIDE